MLKIGDEVYLSEEGVERWVVLGTSTVCTVGTNPISTKGVITDIEIVDGAIDDLGFSVEWSNGYWNSYDEEDLIKVTQEKPVVIGYRRVFNKGGLGLITLSKLGARRALTKRMGRTCVHKNGKQKFRPVYEVNNELE